MKKIIVSSIAALALVIAGSPATYASALAAQKRACQCKPAVKRAAKSTTRTAKRAPARGSNVGRAPVALGTGRATVTGPVTSTYALPQDQYFRLRMNQTLTSESARAGDRFTTTVVTPVYAGGVEVVPAGSTIEGRVTSVVPARSRGREGQISMAFDTLVLPDGTRRAIDGVLTELQGERAEVDGENEVSGKSSDKRRIIYIGGGGAGGAILGGAIGGGKGAAIGAVLGAGAGVAGAMLSKGNEAQVRSGTEIGMVTTRPVVLSVSAGRWDR